MKKAILLPLFMIFMSFSQCDKSQIDKESPSKISEAYFQDWFGGRSGSKGVLVTIKMEKPVNTIFIDSIFFNDDIQKIESSLYNDQLILTANFVNEDVTRRDLILSSNPKEEFGNKPPSLTKKIPFTIKKDQAIISYTKENKKRYFLVKNIRKEKAIYYQ